EPPPPRHRPKPPRSHHQPTTNPPLTRASTNPPPTPKIFPGCAGDKFCIPRRRAFWQNRRNSPLCSPTPTTNRNNSGIDYPSATMNQVEPTTNQNSTLPQSLATESVAPAKISLVGVSKTFRARQGAVLALDNISLNIAEGEFVCLVGPSGCGKSTILNLIAGLETPTEGEVLMDGEVISGPGRDRMVMFQESALFPWLDVLQNVMFGLRLKPNLTNPERAEVAMYYLSLVGLEKFYKSSVHQLSGGMKQRVALARALAPNPKILLMDEPFSALDALTREQLYGDLQRIFVQRQKTIVFVTHNIREAACLGDRIILISPNPGRIGQDMRVDLPRPRDINDPALSRTSIPITAALKRSLGKNGSLVDA
ncbi:MAG: ABC transporter ATP-binding protein, partial [Opitutae bacterium]|nr:ABC transporter ATP-binding protein [Opitutae bacterium]